MRAPVPLQKRWPGVAVIPTESACATDRRAHGKDERVAVKSFHDSRQYLYELVKQLSGGGK